MLGVKIRGSSVSVHHLETTKVHLCQYFQEMLRYLTSNGNFLLSLEQKKNAEIHSRLTGRERLNRV